MTFSTDGPLLSSLSVTFDMCQFFAPHSSGGTMELFMESMLTSRLSFRVVLSPSPRERKHSEDEISSDIHIMSPF